MDQVQAEEQLFECIRRLMASVEGQQGAAASHGEVFLLRYLYGSRGAATPGELSRAMQVSTARVARLLHTLEGRGFLARSGSEEDHRQVEVRLTEAGRAYVEEFQRRAHRRIAAIVEALGEEDTSEYLRITERILAVSGAMTGKER